MNPLQRTCRCLRRLAGGGDQDSKVQPSMNETYDAFEFSRFMADYLKAHPEVVEAQRRDWEFDWYPHGGPRQELPTPDQEQAAKAGEPWA